MSARGRRGNRYYPSEHTYVAALAEAMKQEYQAIVAPDFCSSSTMPFWRPTMTAFSARSPAQVHKHAESRVELMNYALSGIPEDRIRYHVCWGSWNAPHTSDVPLKTMIDLILRVRAQAYLIEAANPRHEHEWQVWKDVKLPDGKILVPGLVSHSTNVVEHPELVQWRIKNFANLVGRENVIAGTDCGFSQNWNIVRVHPSNSVGQARGAGRRRSARQLRLVAACTGPRRQASGVYSVLMWASFTTRPQRWISAAINVRNSSGVSVSMIV